MLRHVRTVAALFVIAVPAAAVVLCFTGYIEIAVALLMMSVAVQVIEFVQRRFVNHRR